MRRRNMARLVAKYPVPAGGGFFTFYVPRHQRVFREKMRELGLREMRYRFDFEGSKVLTDF